MEYLKIKEALDKIPSLDQILEQAKELLGLNKIQPNQILEKFGDYVQRIEAKAFSLYKDQENKAFERLVDMWFKQSENQINEALEKKDSAKIKALFKEFTDLIRKAEFIAGQMRKARGGRTFERVIKLLLNLVGVPCDEPHKETRKVLRRIDLVSPDAETARKTPDKSVFIAAKRTLRERWKQVVPEHMRGARLYLVTVDDNVPEKKADEIKDAGMIIYVLNGLKDRPHLQSKPWVRRLSSLPKDIKNTVPSLGKKE